eukprot:CAMPEP_0205819414 /NCGR_PEP_ID=MMETSP0206-20130828/1780_1 /ASSEMBLY_ACC=CAM_ASM_000279 /TAXON_ID=36767 /ORGANISM="Euplotes focardii, Strain TN1" /LENGTH=430 /DNA_ID=CAMNT_0053112991 /DNA_START=35 /DNA_END=1327 /DNA_ORIENTATION=-
MKLLLLGLGLAAATSIPGYTRTASYDGEMVLTCTLSEKVGGKAFDKLADVLSLDVWGSHKEGTLDIRVANSAQAAQVRDHFKGACEVLIEDVERHVSDIETSWAKDLSLLNATNGGSWFTSYHRYAETIEWYTQLVAANTNIMTWVTIGQSTEGREMNALIISNAGEDAPNIYIQCLIHAREWISGATCGYIANQLAVDFASGDERVTNILSSSRIHLVPFANPDGYEYTWTNNRMWRKSRNSNANSRCVGTDLNRNYDDHWGQGGSSSNPCSDTFRGASPESAIETQNTANYFRSIAPVIGAIDNHAYSQLILRPFGWTRQDPVDEARLFELGALMQSAIRDVHGRSYRNIKSIQLYLTTGTTSDWFYGEDATSTNKGFAAAGYTWELRPTGARPGFQLPPREILPNSEEVYPAWLAFCESIIENPITA